MFKPYTKKALSYMRPYVAGEDMSSITVPMGHVPAVGDMIARDPANHNDQWLQSAAFHAEHYIAA
jgi:sporulation protein YlmC with PRC-barrel domain